MHIEQKLATMGITLPTITPPLGAYVPTVRTGDLVFTSGQIPMRDGALMYTGKAGGDVSVEQAAEAARQCALNALAAIRAEIGDLDRVVRVIKVVGFVNCGLDFTDQPKVVNGASEFLREVFGEAGRHARSAVGCVSLPLGAPVEIEMVVQIAP